MKISNAQLQWRDDGMPYAIDYNDVYFSRTDAAGESAHVFVAANRLRERWAALPAGSRFTVAELGFGSGLNCMQTLRLWQELAPPGCRLHYLAFELHPLTLADMQRLHAQWPDCAAESAQLLQHYADHTAGCHRLHLADNVVLDLYFGEAGALLSNRSTFAHCSVDCWYLDGFNPAQNPLMWQPQLLARVAALSRPGTTLSSYTVAGNVRRALSAAGFTVEKLPGFGRKRHMLLATRQPLAVNAAAEPAAAASDTGQPWFRLPAARAITGHALIVGAGLAGCSTARSLAERGWRVTVLERGGAPATGASGIPQMALRCRLFQQAEASTEFFTQAFLYAGREFNRLQARTNIHWQQCGVLQLAGALNRRQAHDPTNLQAIYDQRVIAAIGLPEANTLAGVELAEAGWWLPRGGWLQPAALCAAYLDHPAIRLETNTVLTAISQQADDSWQAFTNGSKQPSLGTDVVVIANAGAALELAQCAWLPLQEVRGQVTRVLATAPGRALTTVVTGGRTVFPADADGAHTLAATYATENASLQPEPADDLANLLGGAGLFGDPQLLRPAACGSRVALRCNSSDRLPVVGQLAHSDQVVAALGELSRNARHRFDAAKLATSALYYPGLYINTAHGSNGLATCPLSAELLASLICNENLPCAGAIAEALNPIRFLIKALKQQRLEIKS